jgi:hypothetical protein
MSEQQFNAVGQAPQGNRRHDSKFLSTCLLAVLFMLFIAVLEALIHQHLDPVLVPVISGFGGTVLAMIGSIVAFEFGSSKGSQIKDQLNNAPPTPPTGNENK